MQLQFAIQTSRFSLKTLHPEDVTPIYLNWFKEVEVRKYILAANSIKNLECLKRFAKNNLDSEQSLLLGIFTKVGNKHIGNIKFEPIDIKTKESTLGILIGDLDWRGKGVAREVIRGAMKSLSDTLGITRYLLGVDLGNTAAYKAYTKLGFLEIGRYHSGAIKMAFSYEIEKNT